MTAVCPWLRYEVSDVKLPMLFDLCLDGYLDRYDNEYGRLTGGRFRPLNDPAWDAEVWQVWDDEGPWPTIWRVKTAGLCGS